MSTTTIAAPDKPPKIDVLLENIPDEIKSLHRWVTWDWIWSVKQSKWTKPPLQANKMLASSTDSKTWTTFQVAYLLGRNRAGVGFMLGEDVGIVGIDLDKCRNPDTGEIKPLQAEIIRQLNTYAEVSPSGTGVKLLCRGKLPEKCRKANHDLGIEMYCDKRYFTITGHVLDLCPKTINHCQNQIDALIHRFLDSDQASLPRPELASPEEEEDLARSALQAIDRSLADGYTDWLMIGMALHSISPYLLADWEKWSSSSAKFQPGECAKKWATFDGRGVGPGTLYHFAKVQGWIPPRGWKKAKVSRQSVLVENYHKEMVVAADGTERIAKIAHSQKQIVKSIFELFDNWPKRVGKELFVVNNGSIEYLTKTVNLFSWMRESREVVWGNGDEMVSREEVHSSLLRTAESFTDVQSNPHFPPIDGVYYACKSYKPGDGKHLEKMLNLFSPATEEDRQIILAAIATTFWGGPPGQRPAFLVCGAKGAGQGTGKSTVAEFIADLSGGFVEIGNGMDAEKLKDRLLNQDAAKRIARLDNVKTTKLSNEGIEALITSPVISGHKMYVGGTSRPNLMTWFITMNGPLLSRDLAQRCVAIMLKRPVHDGDWYKQARHYITQNKEAIFCDIAAFFERPQATDIDYSRRGLWEKEVLARVEKAADVARVIKAREDEMDDDQKSSQEIEEFVYYKLRDLGFMSPMKVHIPNKVMTAWAHQAIGDSSSKFKNNQFATNLLARLENVGLLFFISKNPSRKYGRGWLYSSNSDDSPINYSLVEKFSDDESFYD